MVFDGAEGDRIMMAPDSGASLSTQGMAGYPFFGPFIGGNTIIETGWWLWGRGWAGLVEGPVILNIERVAEQPGSPIKVTWAINKQRFPQLAGSKVDIYFLKGNGTGQYQPKTGYTKFIANDALAVHGIGLDINVSASTKSFAVSNQVGGGDAELYFKGLIAGSDPNAAGDYGLMGAVAVGKVNINLQRKTDRVSYNTFAVNLLPQADQSLDAVFPAYSFVGVDPTHNKLNADQIREWDGANWDAYFKSKADNSWRSVTDANEAAEYKFPKGYMIRLQKADSTMANAAFIVTTVGKVFPANYQSNVDYGPDPIGSFAGPIKYTAFGNPYPKLASFNDAFAINAELGELTRATTPNKLKADQIRYWDKTSGNWLSCYLANDYKWKLNTNDQSAFDLMIGTGYMFRKADDSAKGAFIWKY